MPQTRIRREVMLGTVREVILDPVETRGGRAARDIYTLNVLDGWVREHARTDRSGMVWASSVRTRSRVGAVLDAAPGCAEFIASSHMLWITVLQQAGLTRQARTQRRALADALARHGLALTPARPGRHP